MYSSVMVAPAGRTWGDADPDCSALRSDTPEIGSIGLPAYVVVGIGTFAMSRNVGSRSFTNVVVVSGTRDWFWPGSFTTAGTLTDPSAPVKVFYSLKGAALTSAQRSP